MLQLSGLQHFAFCRRQWALIHIEDGWKDNYLTIDGELMHERVHDSKNREKRGDVLILRSLSVFSHTLGLSGRCDVVEFHSDEAGIKLFGERGRYRVFPVEYKRGKPKPHNADMLQLCAQAMCMEEMFCCEIKEGALFYGEPKRRTTVEFTEVLRGEVEKNCREMHELFSRGYTPKVKFSKSCKSCSLAETCLPELSAAKPPHSYILEKLNEEETP